jgi:hypothetical protein
MATEQNQRNYKFPNLILWFQMKAVGQPFFPLIQEIVDFHKEFVLINGGAISKKIKIQRSLMILTLN